MFRQDCYLANETQYQQAFRWATHTLTQSTNAAVGVTLNEK